MDTTPTQTLVEQARRVLPGGSFFEVAGGRITRLTTYYNLKKWIALVSA